MAYTFRPPEEKLRIVLEGIRAENISELCRREGICPKDYYRYRDKIIEGALEVLRRNGRKKREPESKVYPIAKTKKRGTPKSTLDKVAKRGESETSYF